MKQSTKLVFESEEAKADMKAMLEIFQPLLRSGVAEKASLKGYSRIDALNTAIRLIDSAPVKVRKVDSTRRPTKVGYLHVIG